MRTAWMGTVVKGRREKTGRRGKGYASLFYWVTFFFFFFSPERKNLSPQEEKNDLKKVLQYRLEELTFLKEEKKYVDSLLKLCEGVKHLIEGAILMNYNAQN